MSNVMSDEDRKATASRFFKAAEQLVCNLAARWMDEHEYESIDEYKVPIDKIAAEHGVRVVRMTKRPFGFTFELGGCTYALKCTSRTYEYRRTK